MKRMLLAIIVLLTCAGCSSSPTAPTAPRYTAGGGTCAIDVDNDVSELGGQPTSIALAIAGTDLSYGGVATWDHAIVQGTDIGLTWISYATVTNGCIRDVDPTV